MSTELVERLRKGGVRYHTYAGPVYAAPTTIEREAADRIEALEQAVDAFADICDELGCERDNEAGLQAAAALKAKVALLTEALAAERKKRGFLEDYANMRDVQIVQLAPFAKWAIRESAFSGSHLEGWEVQEQALATGLILRTVYDPERHGPSDVAEPGMVWFEFSSTLSDDAARRALSEPDKEGT